MKKIIWSSLMIISTIAAVAGATTAFFSDTEESTGNTFAAGDIDLKIDNTSYLNDVYNDSTSWLQPTDLTNELFFDFEDLKPGDRGEDTISIHVGSNPAWVCADITLTSSNDNTCTDPEQTDELDACQDPGVGLGELANELEFVWWADDGDNVFENNETTLPGGNFGQLGVGNTARIALADSTAGVLGANEPLPGGSTSFIAKYWCFGSLTETPVGQDNDGQLGTPGDLQTSNGPDVRGSGFTCDGANTDNQSQTDSMTVDLAFEAVQSRNNDNFECNPTP